MDLLFIGVLITLLVSADNAEEQRVCWYSLQTVGHLSVKHIETSPDYADDYGSGRIQGPNQTCPERTNYCYALWKEDQKSHSTGGIIIIAQGCWESSGKQDCETSSCVTSRKPPKALNYTNFCCCRGDFCNGNVTQMYYSDDIPSEVLPTPVVKYMEKPYVLILVALVILFVFTVSCSVAFILLLRRSDKKKEESGSLCQDSVRLMENGNIHNSNFTVENLKLDEIIGQGRYGAVWKGSVGSQEVAVKIFPSHHKNYFYNEVDIYCVPFMTHPSLLSYFGYDERVNAEGNTEYFLFLSLAPNGTVQEYLTTNVIDWNTFCKMALSIAKGVAYLHSDIRKGDKFKPCVSHRDLNTKNILVKEDLSCVICDLGFATKISGSKYYYNGEEQHAEIKCINDVGTLRYMSPEVLDGAVNLRDCETSLKQVDVYALGLILWEITTRCSDFYPSGIECSPYRLPFEAEIGHPTFEQMKTLIVKHKARPLFPDLWRDSPAIRSVKETIEDCWDQDAEARLTALCVEERFHELCGITERQRVSLFSHGISPTARTSVIQKESQNILIATENKEESCMSESTTDTLVALSTTTNSKNSNQFQGICPAVQPYQGRNPCLERNLMSAQDSDSNSGELVDKSHKNMSSGMGSCIVSDFLNVYPTNSSNQNFHNPIYNGYSNQSEPMMRSNAPIPFLQNVNVEHTIPKQSNLPKPECQSRKISWKNFKKLFETKRRAEDVSPQIDYNVKSNLIANENCMNLSTPTASLETKLETQVSLSNGRLETKIANDLLFSKSLKVNKSDEDCCESTASLLGAQNNKRPNTLPLVKNTEMPNPNVGKSKNNVRNVDKILRNIERSNANLKNYDNRKSSCGLATVGDLKDQGSSKAKSLVEVEEFEILKLDPEFGETSNKNNIALDSKKTLVESEVDKTCTSILKEEKPVERDEEEEEEEEERSALLTNNHHTEPEPSIEKQEIQLKDPNLRVKTPGDLPLSIRKIRGERNAARFSLYDDRIMSGYYDNDTFCGKESSDHSEKFSSFENIKFNQNI